MTSSSSRSTAAWGSQGAEADRAPVARRPADLPGCRGPKNVALAAELADGWFPFWFSPSSDDFYRKALDEGFSREASRHTLDDFEVACPVPVVIDDDVETAADQVRPALALYVGGMGAKDANFHYEVLARLGYEQECERIQEAYLQGRKDEAVAAVTTQMVSDVALVGPAGKVRDELARWDETVVTTLLVNGPPALVRQLAEWTS